MGGATKTRLMYNAYLSYSQLREYLAFLQEKNLMMYDDKVHVYKLTEKGLHFLNVYNEVGDLLAIKGEKNREHPTHELGYLTA